MDATNKWIIGIISVMVVVLTYLVVSLMILTSTPWEEHRLDDYTCAELKDHLMSGEDVCSKEQHATVWPFHPVSKRYYDIQTVYVHYEFRCKE